MAAFTLGFRLPDYPNLHAIQNGPGKWEHTFYHPAEGPTTIEEQFIAMIGYEMEELKVRNAFLRAKDMYDEFCDRIQMPYFKQFLKP